MSRVESECTATDVIQPRGDMKASLTRFFFSSLFSVDDDLKNRTVHTRMKISISPG